MPSDLEQAAALLDASPDYQILRRIQPVERVQPARPEDLRVGVVIDVETTGLDPDADQIIELSMISFWYDADDRIVGVRDVFSQLRDPGQAIPADVTALTGISDEMVAGQAVDSEALRRFIKGAGIFIAFHAAFDRRFAERGWDVFAPKHWACAMAEIDWRAEGAESMKLGHLLADRGLFYRRHRGTDDCEALLSLLSMPLPKSGGTALARLLRSARRPSTRIWAANAPYDSKDRLKARGYRWHDGTGGQPRSWWTDVQEELASAELDYLRKHVYSQSTASPIARRFTSLDRYSARVTPATSAPSADLSRGGTQNSAAFPTPEA